MKCQGCGNPFCNAGVIMRTWRKTMIFRWLLAFQIPAFVVSGIMPSPWSIAGLLLLTGSLMTVGKLAVQAYFRHIIAANPIVAHAVPPEIIAVLTGSPPPPKLVMVPAVEVEGLIADLQGALKSGTLDPVEEGEVRATIARLEAELAGAKEVPGVEGKL